MNTYTDMELLGDIWHLVCFSTWFIEFLEGVLREAVLAGDESALSIQGTVPLLTRLRRLTKVVRRDSIKLLLERGSLCPPHSPLQPRPNPVDLGLH